MMVVLFLMIASVCHCLNDSESAAFAPYHMVTASIINDELVFNTQNEWEEAKKVGFFRIKVSSDLNLEAGRQFAKTFMSDVRYNTFGVVDVVNGYFCSQKAQVTHFTLEKKYWNMCHINQKEADGTPNYPTAIQELGNNLHHLGIVVLKSLLKQHSIPESLWFKATAGCADGEGSHFLLFNCYDPERVSKPIGVQAHKDWTYITVLDAIDPGLEAKINGVWRSLILEEGYLMINFGCSLEKLFPDMTAPEHRVVKQREKMRASTAAFIDPRVGSYREGVYDEDPEGYVYSYDPDKKELVNGETTVAFYTRLGEMSKEKNNTPVE